LFGPLGIPVISQSTNFNGFLEIIVGFQKYVRTGNRTPNIFFHNILVRFRGRRNPNTKVKEGKSVDFVNKQTKKLFLSETAGTPPTL